MRDSLLEALQGGLLAHIDLILGDDDAALDVLQDTLLIVARRIHTLRDPRWLRAWAYCTATREAFSTLKKLKRSVTLWDEMPEMPVGHSDTEEVFDADLIRRVPALVESLPSSAQAVVRLHYLEGMSLLEVSEALEAPLGTVKSRLAYGLRAMRRRLVTDRAATGDPRA